MATTAKKTVNMMVKTLILSTVLLSPVSSYAQESQKKEGVRSVYTNSFKDNWEFSFGVEYLAFYSQFEQNMNLSKSPFKSFRANFGAAATIGKWFTPEIGMRTKASGYWGKAVIGDNADANSIRFYAIQQQAMLNLSNLIFGYSPERLYSLIPYAGAGFVRNCTYNENSVGFGIGFKTSSVSPIRLRHMPTSVSHLPVKTSLNIIRVLAILPSSSAVTGGCPWNWASPSPWDAPHGVMHRSVTSPLYRIFLHITRPLSLTKRNLLRHVFLPAALFRRVW